MTEKNIQDAYAIARQRYAENGVDTDHVLDQLDQVPMAA